jgi:hypothetical protein
MAAFRNVHCTVVRLYYMAQNSHMCKRLIPTLASLAAWQVGAALGSIWKLPALRPPSC